LPGARSSSARAAAGPFGWRAYRLTPTVSPPPGQSAEGGEVKPASAPAGEAAPAARTGDVVLDSKGYIIAAHQIQLSPQVGGEIIWLDPNFKEGAVYKKGDRLAEVDPVIYAARLKSTQAVLRVAEVNLREVETGSALKEIRAARSQLQNLNSKLEMARIDETTKRRAGIG